MCVWCIHYCVKVWFQNRRAKWRRQEKMEASQQLRKFQQEFSSMIPVQAAAAAAAAAAALHHHRSSSSSSSTALDRQLPPHLDHWLSLTSGAAMAYHQATAAAAVAGGYPPPPPPPPPLQPINAPLGLAAPAASYLQAMAVASSSSSVPSPSGSS